MDILDVVIHDNLLSNIFHHLHAKELVKLTRVCTTWKNCILNAFENDIKEYKRELKYGKRPSSYRDLVTYLITYKENTKDILKIFIYQKNRELHMCEVKPKGIVAILSKITSKLIILRVNKQYKNIKKLMTFIENCFNITINIIKATPYLVERLFDINYKLQLPRSFWLKTRYSAISIKKDHTTRIYKQHRVTIQAHQDIIENVYKEVLQDIEDAKVPIRDI